MVRITEEEAKRLGLVSYTKQDQPVKDRKYHNQPCEYHGEKFDSQKELDYYLILLDRQKKSEICDLKRQVKLMIQPKFKTPDGKTIREIYYVADFKYTSIEVDKNNPTKHIIKTHYVDVKGGNATKTATYILKKKLLAYRGFYIEEV